MYFLSDNRLYAKTVAAVAAVFGRDPALIHKWWTQGCPKGRRGRYDIFGMAAWLTDRKAAGESTPEENIAARLRLAKVERAEADAKLQALKAAERAAELMPVADVVRGNVERARALRSACERLKSELPPLVKQRDLKTCRTIIVERIDKTVDQYITAEPGSGGKRKKRVPRGG